MEADGNADEGIEAGGNADEGNEDEMYLFSDDECTFVCPARIF